MLPFASDAFVLRTHKLGETSKVVVLLTRDHGKLRAVARGARGPRSRYQWSLETLSEVHGSDCTDRRAVGRKPDPVVVKNLYSSRIACLADNGAKFP